MNLLLFMKRRKEEDMLRIPGEEFTMQQISVMMMKAQLMDITGGISLQVQPQCIIVNIEAGQLTDTNTNQGYIIQFPGIL